MEVSIRHGREFQVLIGPAHLFQHCDVDLFDIRAGDDIFMMEAGVTWADVLVRLGLFPSKGQARKNGWGGEVEEGWTDVERFGKKRCRISVLKLTLKKWCEEWA